MRLTVAAYIFGEVAGEDDVGDGEGGREEGCDFFGAEAGDAAAYLCDVECEVRVSDGKTDELVDVGSDGVDASLHGGDGIRLSLQAYTLAHDSAETAPGHACGAATMLPGEVAAEDKYLVGAQRGDAVGGERFILHYAVSREDYSK